MAVPHSIRNIAFSSVIKINGRQYEFNFRKPPGSTMQYETDVTDAKGERIMFNMVLEHDKWKAYGAFLPTWIEQHISLIGDTIIQNTDAWQNS